MFAENGRMRKFHHKAKCFFLSTSTASSHSLPTRSVASHKRNAMEKFAKFHFLAKARAFWAHWTQKIFASPMVKFARRYDDRIPLIRACENFFKLKFVYWMNYDSYCVHTLRSIHVHIVFITRRARNQSGEKWLRAGAPAVISEPVNNKNKQATFCHFTTWLSVMIR